MTTYTITTITGEPDGYVYSSPLSIEADTTQQAARLHAELHREVGDTCEHCVLVSSDDGSVGPRGEGRVMLTSVNAEGRGIAGTAATKTARAIAGRIQALVVDIMELRTGHARSLMRLLESVYLHVEHGLDYMNSKVIDEHGGFSPVLPRSDAK